MELHYSLCSKRTKGSEIREVLKYTRLPGVISFAGGLPDPSLFPLEDISRITSEILKEKGFLALQYGPTQGEAEMLEALQYHMEMFGEKATRENLCVTSSSQQGLDLVALTHLDPGDEIVMELPSYLGAIQAFERSGAVMHGIPLENDGMNIDLLEELVLRKEKEGVKLRFIYLIPDYQNPAGVVMSLTKRKRLLEISKRHNIPIIEDSPYREICFCGEVLPSFWTLSGGEGVIQLRTFSKMLFPGMRMGWITAEPEVATKLALMKQSVDLCTPTFNQLIIARFIMENRMKDTIKRAVELYRQKNAVMITALREFMPDYVHWTEPDGGMFLWVTLPETWNAADLVKLAADKGVVFVTGRPFHCNEQGANTLRLNYSFPSVEQIRLGIERLATAIRNYAGH
ncbi:MAG: PLP-dependent aminotransferase family protein [Bacteroidales bacterium]|jgi:2-aminoadipate transaminase|nr:PLP-dependent aminotransferase family protein [Bacteroidales bacterium]NPV35311.1 PLP-dependent aminotransferase family protein [Bacteroidales bacterium]